MSGLDGGLDKKGGVRRLFMSEHWRGLSVASFFLRFFWAVSSLGVWCHVSIAERLSCREL